MKKSYFWVGIIGIIIVGLLVWGSMTNKNTELATKGVWQETNIACLPEGHVSAVLHTHQMLSIMVDGVPEVIPANIGINQTCMAEVHTHDENGKIHVETPDINRTHTLGDFFAVWNKPLMRMGYVLKTTVNGKNIIDGASHILTEGDVISLVYTKI